MMVAFSWGANSYGQLGVGHVEDLSFPMKVNMKRSEAEKLKQIAGGGGHTVFLTLEGKIFVCGWNKDGQLGLPPSDSAILSPVPLIGLQWRVETISCGWSHTLAVVEKGCVMAWGSNAFGQLGLPHVEKQSHVPTHLSSKAFGGGHVAGIAAGLRHSLALTESGQVYSWGDGRKGQLGLDRSWLGVQRQPTLVPCFGKFTLVKAGAYHSTALVVDGSVLSWGLNQHGQCGLGLLTDELKQLYSQDNFKLSGVGHIVNVYVPVRVEGVASLLAEISCGWSHTLGITHGKEVFAWGRCDYGQLGRDVTADLGGGVPPRWNHVPKLVPHLNGVKQLACGSEHSLAINGDDQVVSFGWNEHGMCGTGDKENVSKVMTTAIASCDGGEGACVMIGTGAGHSMAVVKLNSTSST